MTLSSIKSKFYELCKKISAPSYLATFRTTPSHDGSPHVEQEGNKYVFIVTERGSEFERRSTTSQEEILFWLLEGVTHQMATNYELNNRIEDQDCRIIYFPKHVELLNTLNSVWAKAKAHEYRKILGPKYKGLYG